MNKLDFSKASMESTALLAMAMKIDEIVKWINSQRDIADIAKEIERDIQGGLKGDMWYKKQTETTDAS